MHSGPAPLTVPPHSSSALQSLPPLRAEQPERPLQPTQFSVLLYYYKGLVQLQYTCRLLAAGNHAGVFHRPAWLCLRLPSVQLPGPCQDLPGWRVPGVSFSAPPQKCTEGHVSHTCLQSSRRQGAACRAALNGHFFNFLSSAQGSPVPDAQLLTSPLLHPYLQPAAVCAAGDSKCTVGALDQECRCQPPNTCTGDRCLVSVTCHGCWRQKQARVLQPAQLQR